MAIEKKHRILLVNFTEKEAALIRKSGFNVELGYIGRLEKRNGEEYLPYFFPHPPYEYELYVYNSKIPAQEVAKLFTSPKNLLADEKMAETLSNLGNSGVPRIAFIGVSSGVEKLYLGGVPSIQILEAHEGVSVLEIVKSKRTFSIPELEDTIIKLRKRIVLPVGQYLCADSKSYPVYHFPVVLNRVGDEIASYGAIYSKRSIPIYIVLPQLENNASGLVEVLNVVTKLRPELFPDIKTHRWYESEEFAFREEKAIDEEISERISDTKEFVEAKQREKNAIAERYSFIREILIAREDLSVEADRRLSTNVRKLLEFLGFEVEDVDAKIRGAIKKEDFWVRDGDFLAITEVTGTNSKNPKITEYNGILGRLTTIFKRQDMIPNAADITGLLVVNHDIDTHPTKRPLLYSGDLEEIAEGAKEQGIGLLSTVELYKIAVAAKDGKISAEQARKLIRQPGRIEFED
jgi:hypothetical protein